MTAPADDVVVSDAPTSKRFQIRVGGSLAGFSTYRLRDDLITFVHTETLPEFAGLGLGSRLVRGELDEARSRGLSVRPRCPFVRAFIAKHADYLDLVRVEDRADYDL